MKYILTLSILIQLWIFTALSPEVFSSTGHDDEEKPGFVLTAAPKQASSMQSLLHNPDSPFYSFGENIAWGQNAWIQKLFSKEWSSSGNGSFDDISILNASYSPGSLDIAAGEAELCLSAVGYDGSVVAEDCMTLTILSDSGLDFGDAPELGGMFFSFPTTLANGGAAHVIDPAIFLGNKIDGEPDGQPSIGADGDDNDLLYPSSGDDEDGVILPAL